MADKKKFLFEFEGDARDLQRATDGVGKDMDGLGGRVSGAAGKIGGAIAGAFAVGAVVNFGTALYDIGVQADLWNKKAGIVFGDQIGDIEEWASGAAGAMGLTESALIGSAAAMADLLVPMGFTREQAADMTMDMQDLSGALSAWSGGTYDAAQVSELLSKALLGETDGLKALGISISAAEVQQRALEMAQADGRTEVTALDEALATQSLVLEKSTDAQTAWADGTFDSTKKANELKAQVEELKEKLGTALLPVVQRVTAWLVDDFIPAMQDLKEWLWPKLQEAHDQLAAWWDEHGPTIVSTAETIRDAAVDLGTGIANMWSSDIKPALDDLKAAWDELSAKVSEAITAITGDSDGMQVNWEKVGEAIGVAIGLLIDALTLFVDYVGDMAADVRVGIDAAKAVINPALDAIRGTVDNLRDSWNALRRALGQDVTAPKIIGGPVPKNSVPAGASHGGTWSVPGAPGADVPTILQAGERVLSVAQARSSSSGAGMGGPTIIVNAYGATGREMIDEIERAVRDGARASWLAA